MTRCNDSKFVIRQRGLHPLRSIAKKIENQNGQSSMKESIASALSLLYAGEVPLSLEESQRWSGILLRWIFDKSVSDKTQLTAVKILSCILEDYGPASVPISQGWLALVLSEILGDNKAQNSKGTAQPEPERVKVLISFLLRIQNFFLDECFAQCKDLKHVYTQSHQMESFNVDLVLNIITACKTFDDGFFYSSLVIYIIKM
jgi:hypothetical protein